VLTELSAQSPDNAIDRTMEGVLEGALAEGVAEDAVIAQSERERLGFLQLREAISDAELAEGGAVKHDISVPIALMPETVGAVRARVARDFPGCRLNIFGHLGDGNLHVNVRPPAGKTLADLGPLYRTITEAVEALAVEHGGSFSAEHGIGQLRASGLRRHKPDVDIALMTALKQAIDPRNLMNPGKILSDPKWS
jgi:FAD/FMN-containing dehydrogenase